MAQEDNTALIAAVISLFIPGIGHIYGGAQQRGIIWFVATAIFYVVAFIGTIFLIGAILWLVAPIVHLAAGADAYIQFN